MSLNLERKLAQRPKAPPKEPKEVIIFKSPAEELRWRIEQMQKNPVRELSWRYFFRIHSGFTRTAGQGSCATRATQGARTTQAQGVQPQYAWYCAILCLCLKSIPMTRHITGSSAGAGSGEFHVYRHDKERELRRQKWLDEQEKKVPAHTPCLRNGNIDFFFHFQFSQTQMKTEFEQVTSAKQKEDQAKLERHRKKRYACFLCVYLHRYNSIQHANTITVSAARMHRPSAPRETVRVYLILCDAHQLILNPLIRQLRPARRRHRQQGMRVRVRVRVEEKRKAKNNNL